MGNLCPSRVGPRKAVAACVVLFLMGGACARDTAPTDADVADTTTSAGVAAPETSEPTAATFTVVPDPRPGDLRSATDGDVLPADYAPPVASSTLRDVAYGDDPHQRLDLHLPSTSFAPVVVYLHAGGWEAADRDSVPPMVMRFVERGYAVASISLRASPQHTFPAAVEDTKHAVRWLKASSALDGLVDGDRIVLFGTSSGGHLAAFVAATPGRFEPTDLDAAELAVDSTVAGIVSAVGPTDLEVLYATRHPWAFAATEAFLDCSPCSPGRLAEASPITYLHPDLPPAYWAYGEDDPIAEPTAQGATMAAAWGAQIGWQNSWCDLVDDAGHNLDQTPINQRFLERFIDEVTVQ